MRKLAILLAATAAAVASPAFADIVYSNNFDTDNGGNTAVNFNGFTGLTVIDGSMDLVHTGDGFGLNCNGGSGGCVDLDGSTSDAGVLVSNLFYDFGAGDTITLAYSVSGNQRSGSEDMRGRFTFDESTSFTNYGYTFDGTVVNLGPVTTSIYSLFLSEVPSGFEWTDFTMFVTTAEAGSVQFSFFTSNSNDNIGPLLDDVSLDISAVPEASTWAMMIGGFGLVGGALRRRARTDALATA